MTTIDFITALFCQVDDPLAGIPKHPHATLWPSEIVTLGILHALGIHVRRDDLVSVMYSAELNSATSSITRQRTDQHGILAEKSPDIQLFS